MDEMKPLICQCCGGHIDKRTLKCLYCETQYNEKIEQVLPVLHLEPDGIETVSVSVMIPEEVFMKSKEAAMQLFAKRAGEALLKGILPYVNVVEQRDMRSFNRILSAKIKIVKE